MLSSITRVTGWSAHSRNSVPDRSRAISRLTSWRAGGHSCGARAQQSGQIVNISAAAVIANYAGFSIYGATKWALEGVSESLAAELKPLGIKVTIVQPGPFRTTLSGARWIAREATPPTTIAQAESSCASSKRWTAKSPATRKATEAIIAAIESTRRRCGSSPANTQTTKCAENLRQPKQNSLPIAFRPINAYTP